MQHLRIVPTLTHALLDHLLAIVLIISPWIFEFHAVRGPAVQAPMIFGGLLVITNLLTEHELGLFKTFSMPVHLHLDVFIGVLLAASPWLCGFSDRIVWPHLIGGSFIALLPLLSARKPFDESLYTEVVIREGRAEVVRYARSSDSSASIDP